jgi:hypothetical protein
MWNGSYITNPWASLNICRAQLKRMGSVLKGRAVHEEICVPQNDARPHGTSRNGRIPVRASTSLVAIDRTAGVSHTLLTAGVTTADNRSVCLRLL